MTFYHSLGEGCPTKIDYRTKGSLILTSLLEDLARLGFEVPKGDRWAKYFVGFQALRSYPA